MHPGHTPKKEQTSSQSLPVSESETPALSPMLPRGPAAGHGIQSFPRPERQGFLGPFGAGSPRWVGQIELQAECVWGGWWGRGGEETRLG